MSDSQPQTYCSSFWKCGNSHKGHSGVSALIGHSTALHQQTLHPFRASDEHWVRRTEEKHSCTLSSDPEEIKSDIPVTLPMSQTLFSSVSRDVRFWFFNSYNPRKFYYFMKTHKIPSHFNGAWIIILTRQGWNVFLMTWAMSVTKYMGIFPLSGIILSFYPNIIT